MAICRQGIFQFEGDFAHQYLSKLLSRYDDIRSKVGNISRVDIMSLANGAIRPAGDSYRDDMANGIVKDNNNDGLNSMMSNTIGYLVYQEQIIEFLNKFCGYTMGEADVVRRGFAKKTGTDEHIPKLLEWWCKNKIIKVTLDFTLKQDGIVLFGFHDRPDEFYAALSERTFVERLAKENIIRCRIYPPAYGVFLRNKRKKSTSSVCKSIYRFFRHLLSNKRAKK